MCDFEKQGSNLITSIKTVPASHFQNQMVVPLVVSSNSLFPRPIFNFFSTAVLYVFHYIRSFIIVSSNLPYVYNNRYTFRIFFTLFKVHTRRISLCVMDGTRHFGGKVECPSVLRIGLYKRVHSHDSVSNNSM